MCLEQPEVFVNQRRTHMSEILRGGAAYRLPIDGLTPALQNRHRSHKPKLHNNEKGFSLPLAIFILVIVSLLALAIFRMTALNQQAVAQEVLTARALFAAESGAQVQMMRIFPISGPANCAAHSIAVTTAGLNACSFNSTCSVLIVNSQSYYNVESIGRCAIGGVSAQRTIQMQAHGS